MGTRIFQHSSSFFMSADNQVKASEAAKRFAKTSECYEARALDNPSAIDLLKAYNYIPRLDSEGNIVGIRFQGGKLLDDGMMFHALAPFVSEGSFIAMSTWPDQEPAITWTIKQSQCWEQSRI